MKRVLALYLPFLSTDRLRRSDEKELSIGDCRLSIAEKPFLLQSTIDNRQSTTPIVTVAAQGQTLRVVQVNEAAAGWRLRGGQTLAEARALVPSLVAYDDDPPADGERLESLALWVQRFSPVVQIEGSDVLWVDVTGCERLFGGETRLLEGVIAGVRAQGLTVRGAIADTPGAAWALAHAHADALVVSEPGQAVVDLTPLPVGALRIDPPAVEALARVGIETVGALLHLPRSTLSSRFGEAVLERIDQALGDLPEPLTPFAPRAALSERLDWGAPVGQWDLLLEAVRRVTTLFCEQLARRVAGVREVLVTFECPGVVTDVGMHTRRVTLEVGFSRPTRSAKHLFGLLKVRLEGLRLPAPAEAVTVWAKSFESLDDPQTELFDTEVVDARALSDLLDRLTLRLGAPAVVRATPVSDHQPERAYRYAAVTGESSKCEVRSSKRRQEGNNQSVERKRHDGRSDGGTKENAETPKRRNVEIGVSSNFELRTSNFPRPLRLSAKPVPVTAMSVVPDGPPISFRLRGVQHDLVSDVGPERIETGWWRGPHVQRDYYRAVVQDGRRVWLFRDRRSGQWFLHGWFD